MHVSRQLRVSFILLVQGIFVLGCSQDSTNDLIEMMVEGPQAGVTDSTPTEDSQSDALPENSSTSEAVGDEGEVSVRQIDSSAPLPVPRETTRTVPDAITSEGTTTVVTGDCQGQWIQEVRGWVLDEVGNVLTGAKVQACLEVFQEGSDTQALCLRPADVDIDGSYTIQVPTQAMCIQEIVLRSIVPRVAFSPMYCHAQIDQVDEDQVLRLTDPLILYETRPAQNVSIDGNTTTADFDDQLSISFDSSMYESSDIDLLSSRNVPLDAPGLCFLHNNSDTPVIDQLFVLYPETDLISGLATVQLSNSMGYPAGASVDFYVLGNIGCTISESEYLKEGAWEVMAKGRVSDDGTMINTEADMGLPCLTWLGVSRTP